jgi:phosphatidylserine decarboxylase
MGLAPYGRNVIYSMTALSAAIALGVLALHGGWWALAALVPFLFTLYFFRDPERSVPGGKVIVSAADGHVTAVEEVEEKEYIGGKAKRISVFLSIFDVHLNRAPVSGKVEHVKHVDGRFLNAMKARSAVENERNFVGLSTAIGKVLVVQIAGAIARRIRCAVKPGDVLNKGERFGMIMFGSRTDLYLPPESVDIRVKAGDVVRAGKTIIAEIRDAKN